VDSITLLLFCCTLFIVATLYSCVGQSGGSGFIAAMAFFGFAPSIIKPTSLALNIFVSAIVAVRFWRDGHFRWRLFWPLALSSVPCAVIGGYLNLPNRAFKMLLGSALLIGALPFFRRKWSESSNLVTPPFLGSLLAGAGVGLLSGLTAIGGGILITPILLFFRWASTKSAAAVSAMFILVNSIAAMAGHLSNVQSVPKNIPLFAIAAGAGGFLGSHLGSRILPVSAIRLILGGVLIIAGVKLLGT